MALSLESLKISPQNGNTSPLEALPADLIFGVLDFVPGLDYYHLKLAGSRYITDAVRNYTSRLTRGKQLRAISEEDARRNKLRKGTARSALEITIERGQEAVVRHFLRKYHGNTPPHRSEGGYQKPEKRVFQASLHWAAYYGSARIAQLLLDRIDIRSAGSQVTPLHIAAARGHANIADILLTNGAEINVLDADAKTPLQLALEQNQGEVASLLQSKGAVADAETLIHSRNDWMKLLQGRFTLRGRRPRTNRKPAGTETRGLVDVLRALVKCQYTWLDTSTARARRQRASMMRAAIQHNLTAIVCMFLNDGFDVHTRLDVDLMPLSFAVLHGRNEIAKLLTSRGADLAFAPPACTNMQFRLAAFEGNEARVQRFLEAGYPVNAQRANAGTPLHLAAAGGKLSIITLLIQSGADVNIRRPSDWKTPLFLAAENGQDEAVRLLLEHKADPSMENKDSQVALHVAARRGATDLLAPLLSGSDIDREDRLSWTALHYAAHASQPATIRILLGFGADATLITGSGVTPLTLACEPASLTAVLEHSKSQRMGNELHTLVHTLFHGIRSPMYASPGVVIDTLAKFGADFDARTREGDSAIHLALRAISEDPSLVKVLLKYDVDVNAIGSAKLSPLILALGTCHGEKHVLQCLLQRGADVNWQDTQGRTVLHHASSGTRGDICFDCVDLVMDRVDDLDVVDESGLTPIFLALKRRAAYIAYCLLNEGARADVTDKRGCTPLHYALSYSLEPDLELVEMLISQNADVNARDDHGRTSLLLAIDEAASWVVVDYLLRQGADVHAYDNEGRTALHCAVVQPYPWSTNVLELLLNHGAPMDVPDVRGKTPLDLAIESGKQDHVNILQSFI